MRIPKPWLKRGLSAAAAAALLIAASEGVIYRAQPDVATGQPNICYGDTHDVRVGDVATPAECKARLATQLAAANAVVDSCIPTPPTRGVRAALDDFAYNMGPGRAGVHGHDGLCVLRNGRKPTIRLRAEAGDWRGVCDAFLAWRKDGDKFPGLITRRGNERELCLKGLP